MSLEFFFLILPLLLILFNIILIQIKYNKLTLYIIFISNLFIFVIYCILSCYLDFSIADIQYKYYLNFIPYYFGIHYLMVDSISYFFLLLTGFLFPLCVLYIYTESDKVGGYLRKKVTKKQSLTILLFLEFCIILCFTVSDFFCFYVAFEVLLIPMILLIFYFGSRGRKVHSIYLFLFYTLIGSLFLLFSLLLVYNVYGNLEFNYAINLNKLTIEEQKLLTILLFFGFAVKIPVFPVHLWLPEAHVEAPTVGSVLLAGILLKLGGYGMLRLLLPLSSNVLMNYKPFFITLISLSILYGGLAAIRQIDLKKIIAYSSVVHMNIGLLGLFTQTSSGLIGFIYLMVSHGIISSALFFTVGMLYERIHTKNILYIKGLYRVMPKFSILLLLFCLANLSLPGTCNFIGEILVFIALGIENSYFALIIGVFSAFFCTLFCLILIVKPLYYQIDHKFSVVYDLTNRETFILFLLFIYIIIFGVCPGFIISNLEIVEFVSQT